jgi:four helix bundle protein
LQVLRSGGGSTFSQSATVSRPLIETRQNQLGIPRAPVGAVTARTYGELRAWQTVRAFKVGVYALTEQQPIAGDFKLRDQLREAAASAQSQIAEGFGRFEPLDNARFVRMARASLLECHNHLSDAVDRGYLIEGERLQHEARFRDAIREIGGYLDYLQSPEAKRNAERIRQRRVERRNRRNSARGT